MGFWDAVSTLPTATLLFFAIALIVAFGFEFINGFHDTANAVTTVIYTRSLPATPAVLYSGTMNFLGVLLGGTGVAFGIVNLLPVEILVDAKSSTALVMVLALLLAGVVWNLGTWYLGLPVSSSHTLIGSILGVGLANSLLTGRGLTGVNWDKAGETGLSLLATPLVGFGLAYLGLLLMKKLVPSPRLYTPPVGDDRPPGWVRGVLIATCGGVSLAHGSNDGQKGMGLLLMVLIGFLPAHYALTQHEDAAARLSAAVPEARAALAPQAEKYPKAIDGLTRIETATRGASSFNEVQTERWELRTAIFEVDRALIDAKVKDNPDPAKSFLKPFRSSIEFVPLWVVIGTAVALGLGTTIGYKRIVITVAEKIGKTHLTYAQGAVAETVTALTILAADRANLPASTTQVLSSGVAGTMAANGSGIQGATARKILLAWVCTLPCTMLLAGLLFMLGRLFV